MNLVAFDLSAKLGSALVELATPAAGLVAILGADQRAARPGERP